MSIVEELRSKVLAEIHQLELLQADSSKDVYRLLHLPAVQMQLKQNQNWIQKQYPKYAKYFANGYEIEPLKIQPYLIEVTESWHSDLFRLARLTWSLPFTSGYGRRLRFIIMDDSNEKLIGILGLQSPPLDFAVRDKSFNYPENSKVELVNQTMDIFTLGAIPPYNQLLGGKLISLAAASNEMRQAYRQKYEGRITEMDKKILPAHLVALTTTSAFGRSSIYNRLKYKDQLIAYSIGYTQGYGSFHLATLYPLLKEFLEQQGVSTQSGFGVGPRRVWRICRQALERLDLSGELLKHGLRREAFLFPLVSNLEDYMEGHTCRPAYYHQPFQDLAAWWRKRWLLPRAERIDDWYTWDKGEIEQMLIIGKQ